jgi:AraC-like DNA-binding protein
MRLGIRKRWQERHRSFGTLEAEELDAARAGRGQTRRSLGISERTLHRRLSESETSFQDVLDQFRIEVSERHLRQGKLDLAAVALVLAFSDQAAWNRFFRRLRNMSPTAWQNAHGQKG